MVSERLEQWGVGYQMGESGVDQHRPTLVMIHGAGGRAQIWQNQIRALDPHMNTLALDLPGHGESRDGGKDRIEDYAQWLGQTLEELFRGPVFLMGHSMGGAVAMETALTRPQLVQGMILAGTGARLKVAPAFLEGLLNQFEETVETIIGYGYTPGAEPAMKELGARMMKATGSAVVHGDFLASDRFDRRKDLGEVAVPCLIVCGSADKLTPPPLSESLHQSISGSRLEILPDQGHFAMVEGAGPFNDQVREFVLAHRT